MLICTKHNPTPQEAKVISLLDKHLGGYTLYKDGRYKLRQGPRGYVIPVFDEKVFTPECRHASGPGATFRSAEDAITFIKLHIDEDYEAARKFRKKCYEESQKWEKSQFQS